MEADSYRTERKPIEYDLESTTDLRTDFQESCKRLAGLLWDCIVNNLRSRILSL